MMKCNQFGLLLALFVPSVAVNAATISLVGDSVTYQYDDVANAAALALFGAPTIIGDDVRFLPPSFIAQSTNGQGLHEVDANFIFSRVYSHSGSEIMNIEVVEFGDYEIVGGDGVSAVLELSATSNLNAVDNMTGNGFFSASGDSSGLQVWTMSASIDPSLGFYAGPANDLVVAIHNTLKATTGSSGELAWIQKKLSFTAVTVTEVPVPAALWLFGAALVGLAGVKRNK